MKMRVAVYAGSFNEFHKGHLDVANKASRLFDKVIICQAQHPKKPAPLELPHRTLQRLGFETLFRAGLLPYYVEELETMLGYDVTLVRGIRNLTDFSYEQDLAKVYLDIKPDIKMTYVLADPTLDFVSSSLIKAYPKEFGKYLVK